MTDAYDARARRWLLCRLVDTNRASRINYAPDSRYDGRALVQGPHTLHISGVLNHWAQMWAADMREAKRAEIEIDAKDAWERCMNEADAEILRYLSNNHIERAA